MGVIQNYSDLQAAIADNINRTDMANEILDWINVAHIQIQEYVGALDPLVVGGSTNAMLQYDPYIYLWGALAEAYFFLRNIEQAEIYATKFQARLNDQAMTGFGFLAMAPAACPPRQLFPFQTRYLWAGTPPVANATGC